MLYYDDQQIGCCSWRQFSGSSSINILQFYVLVIWFSIFCGHAAFYQITIQNIRKLNILYVYTFFWKDSSDERSQFVNGIEILWNKKPLKVKDIIILRVPSKSTSANETLRSTGNNPLKLELSIHLQSLVFFFNFVIILSTKEEVFIVLYIIVYLVTLLWIYFRGLLIKLLFFNIKFINGNNI